MKFANRFLTRMSTAAVVAALAIAVVQVPGAPAALAASNSVTGKAGQVLSASQVRNIRSGEALVVSGKNFDTTVGIYVEMCVIVPATQLPNPCGGGVNMTGASAASYWISSNPPSYGKGLAIAYGKGGSFKVTLKVSPKIGSIDCRKTACAIYVRADHTRTQDRTHDLYLPISFSN